MRVLMWDCPKCRERIADEFQVCWKCGTSWDGVEDPTFVRVQDGRAESESQRPTDGTDSSADSPSPEEETADDSPHELPDAPIDLRGRRRFRLSGFATAG